MDHKMKQKSMLCCHARTHCKSRSNAKKYVSNASVMLGSCNIEARGIRVILDTLV